MSAVRRWSICCLILVLAGCEDPEPVASNGGATGPLEQVDRILSEVGEELASEADAGGGGEAVKVKPVAPVAEAVAGEPGFVISPFNGRKIDVRGVPAGTLVADPHFPAAEKKYFVVPEPASVPAAPEGEAVEDEGDGEEPKV